MAHDGRGMGVTRVERPSDRSEAFCIVSRYGQRSKSTWRKLTLISLVLLGLGLALWVEYVVQRSYVDEDGVLQEPFHLLALDWFFILTGGVALMVALPNARLLEITRHGIAETALEET